MAKPKPEKPKPQKEMTFMRERMQILGERGREQRRTIKLAKMLQNEGKQ